MVNLFPTIQHRDDWSHFLTYLLFILGEKFAKTSLTVVFVTFSSVIGLVLVMVGIFVCFKITRGSFRQTGKAGDKNIDTKSYGMNQHYDDLYGTEREVAYTALGQSEKEATYENM